MCDFTKGGYAGRGSPDDKSQPQKPPQGTVAPAEQILSDEEARAFANYLIRIGPDDV